jgi:hypothetical protein
VVLAVARTAVGAGLGWLLRVEEEELVEMVAVLGLLV